MNLTVANGFYLSEFVQSDKNAIVDCLREKEIYDRTLRIPYPYTAADAQQWLDIVGQTTKTNGQPVIWAIHDDAGTLIGAIGLDDLIIGKRHRAELGYWLAKRFWGRGIMTAVVQSVCRHAFENLGLIKISAHVFSSNDASCRVLEKCGFRQEGLLRKQFLKDGQFIDAKLYGRENDMAVPTYSPPELPSEAQSSIHTAQSHVPFESDRLIVRPCRENDKGQVVQLWTTVFPDDPPWNSPVADFERKSTTQPDLFLVGEISGEIVATVMAGFDGHRGWVHRVAVAPRLRRRGFGRVMMAEAENRLRAVGCTKINLQVRATNQVVVAFYESLNYAIEDRISMAKRLN